MYIAISAFLALIYLSVAVSHFFITDKKWAQFNKRACIVSGAAGILSSVFISVLFYVRSSSFSEGDKEWAGKVFSGYLKDVLPVLGVILLILLLSSVFQPKMKPLRVIITLVSSVFVLVFGYIASFLAENENVSVTFYICALSISLSVAVQFCGFRDFGRLYERLEGEEKAKTKKKKRT